MRKDSVVDVILKMIDSETGKVLNEVSFSSKKITGSGVTHGSTRTVERDQSKTNDDVARAQKRREKNIAAGKIR
ncbi:MAG: hypothetical protein IPO08_00090 [Xanthomonadales bacterium]|nr:hypothetical protein [Xanthomonadales bacterium]